MSAEVRFIKSVDALSVLRELQSKFDLDIPDQFEVEIRTSYESEVAGVIELKAQYADVLEATRRKLKTAFNLDVPFWQKESSGTTKDLEGDQQIRGWKVQVYLHGAFTCEIIGQEDQPPRQTDLELAEVIATLDSKQIEYLVALKVWELTKPRVKHIVDCKPA